MKKSGYGEGYEQAETAGKNIKIRLFFNEQMENHSHA